MFNVRRTFYNSMLLAAALLPAAGCGKPAPPPQGAAENATAPTVDLGTESAPKDAAANPSDAKPAGESPQAQQGDQK